MTEPRAEIAALTDAEHAALQTAVIAWSTAEPGLAALNAWPGVVEAVERIVSERLAPVGALANEWDNPGWRGGTLLREEAGRRLRSAIRPGQADR